MADESDLLLFNDYLKVCCGTSQRTILPRTNPFDEYDDRKFKERFRLSKPTVFRLLSEVNIHFISIQFRNYTYYTVSSNPHTLPCVKWRTGCCLDVNIADYWLQMARKI